MGQGGTAVFALVFSSSTGQWRAVPPRSWTDLLPGSISSTENPIFYCRRSAYGCFYWVTNKLYWRAGMKMLVLDTRSMEFSMVEPPREAKPRGCQAINVAMVEAGEGRPGMFVLQSDPYQITLHYTILQNNGESSSGQWQWQKTLALDEGSWYLPAGSVRGYLLLVCWGRRSFQRSYFTMDIETFKFQRVCGQRTGRAYSNFPPMLSAPTVSSGTPEGGEAMLEQGAEALRVGEAIQADAVGWSGVLRTGDDTD